MNRKQSFRTSRRGASRAPRNTTETYAAVAASSRRRRPVRAPAISSRVNFIRSTDPQTSEQPAPSSILHLIGQVAKSAEDKYCLLQQRDKILRQAMPKQTDLDLSKVFVGTCPDMCPEKERYMKEAFHLLSSFELIPNTKMLDHTAAIKEYRRSSADQEEPLPHELRPLTVLSMTMDYLVTQIMDRGHDNNRDWYNYVWNRTRAIRKDIIQQCLCCPQTAALIEKCLRFHIHCGHHFCEEPMMSFDPKMNDENIWNCLQTLREMYQDLAAQQVYCPDESEFRQYGLLLSLDNCNVYREVQQFRDEVRNSPEVKFALEVFAALRDKCFVRFFELVKGASYLASCLLHRYFNQVRAKALTTLIHTASSHRPTTVPVEDMVQMFMFPSTTEAAGFIQQYGLSVNNSMVTLSQKAFKMPRLPLSPKRSEAIMEKKTMLIGEVVNGGALPSPPQHTPVCSFDSQNKYRGVSAAKPDVEALPEVESQPQMKKAKLLAEPRLFRQPQASNEPAKAAAADETGEPSESSGRSVLPAESQKLFQPIIKAPSAPPRPVSSHEHAKAANYATTTLWPVRRHELVAVRRQRRRQKKGFPAASGNPGIRLKARAPSAPAKPSMVDVIRGLVNLGNTGTRSPFINRWLKMRRQVSYRYQQLLDESVFSPLDLPALVTEMIPNPPDRIIWKAALLLPSDKESVASLADEVLSNWLQVKLGGDSKGSEVEEQRPDGTLQRLYVDNTLQENGQRTHKVHINIKVSRGPLTEDSPSKAQERHELQGTRALIMLLHALPTPEPGHKEQDKSLASASLQLQQVLQASTWHCPMPLVILVPGPDGETRDTLKVQEALMLEKLVTEGFISQYIFLSLPESMTDMQGSAQLTQAMRWLLGRIPPPNPLSFKTVEQRVQANLSCEFSSRVCAHHQEQAASGPLPGHPAPVVQLHNAVLAHLSDVVSSLDLSRLGGFCPLEIRDSVPPLNWNPAQYLAWLRKGILSLQPPQWELPVITATAAKPEVEALPEVESQQQMKKAKLLAEPRLFRQPQASNEPAKAAAADETGEPSESSGRSVLPAESQKLFQPIIKAPSAPPRPVSSHEHAKAANYTTTTLWPVRRHELVAVRQQRRRQKKGFPAASGRVNPGIRLKARAPSTPAKPSTADVARGLVNLDISNTRSPS